MSASSLESDVVSFARQALTAWPKLPWLVTSVATSPRRRSYPEAPATALHARWTAPLAPLVTRSVAVRSRGAALSMAPSQLSSMPLHTSVCGAPGAQESCTAPATHDVAPVRAQAPTPHVVATATYPSSVEPLQLLSIPSQLASLAPGCTAGSKSLQSCGAK